ncbi:hypothetical protein MFLO_01810 [Listeria floridensis FSL S10-1187]|uniref:Cyclic nucleotide phosphodiesterase C-terminal domain-containing protein n=1 Tax=Listeria floridensis FSL S10-1187 TaxID=1265817 RepID=A0ABN0RIV9_9LIST|nr:hypothetical protein MFLO_01810 [Listeria floridensis FSL S10-1187]
MEQAADLPGFNERDRRNFYAIGYDKAMSEIASSDVFDQFSEQEKQALANTMAVNNQAYFTGTAPKETPGLKLWKKVSNHFLRNYVLSTAGKPKQNNNYWAEK